MLDETLPAPRVPRVRLHGSTNKKATLQGAFLLVEAAGISRSSRLQARIRYGSVEHARRNPAYAPRPAGSITWQHQ